MGDKALREHADRKSPVATAAKSAVLEAESAALVAANKVSDAKVALHIAAADGRLEKALGKLLPAAKKDMDSLPKEKLDVRKEARNALAAALHDGSLNEAFARFATKKVKPSEVVQEEQELRTTEPVSGLEALRQEALSAIQIAAEDGKLEMALSSAQKAHKADVASSPADRENDVQPCEVSMVRRLSSSFELVEDQDEDEARLLEAAKGLVSNWPVEVDNEGMVFVEPLDLELDFLRDLLLEQCPKGKAAKSCVPGHDFTTDSCTASTVEPPPDGSVVLCSSPISSA